MAAVIAVLLAVLGAAGIAAGTAAQQRLAQTVGDPAGAAALLNVVLRRPRWWTGQALITLGFASYAAALAFGPLVAVQPVLVTGLVFGTVFSARLARRRLDRTLVLGGLLCVAGLVGFLLLARPSGPDTGGVVLDVVPLLVAAVAALALGGLGLTVPLREELPRALVLALATGGFYGLTATLLAPVMQTLVRDPGAVLLHWPVYGAVVSSVAGWALSQRAFQLGRVLAPVNAVIVVADPAVAVVLGVTALGEGLAVPAGVLPLVVLAVGCVVGGVVVLSRRGARLIADVRAAGQENAAAVPWG